MLGLALALALGVGLGGQKVGSDRDTHGCIGSAGFKWCEGKQECVRRWELEADLQPGETFETVCDVPHKVETKEVVCRVPRSGLLYGVDQHHKTASSICCNNHRWAEPSGFLVREVGLFSNYIDATGEVTFYDTVCGLPLFIAPRGRSFQEWKDESVDHGWPSFRPEEYVKENVVVEPGGRMVSVCGTHLGHNIPDARGARACIDLVCIAAKGEGSAPKALVHAEL